jgi:hypothetical protein
MPHRALGDGSAHLYVPVAILCDQQINVKREGGSAPSPAATAGVTGVLRFPSIRGRSRPVTPHPEKQCGAAFGWTSGSTFISRRTLGSVRLLLSTPLVQLRAAYKPPCSLPRPLRASGVDSASLRPIRQS